MNDDKNLVKMLALLVFFSCSVTAFSLGALSYTFVTGDLPFGLIPMVTLKVPALSKPLPKPEAKKEDPIRFGEDFMNKIWTELQGEREKFAAEKEVFASEKKNAEIILQQAKEMQTKVEATENRVKSLLVQIDETEQRNVSDMQKLIAGMEPAPASQMLLDLDEKIATRILWIMDKKVAALVVTEARKNPDKEKLKKLQRITDGLQRQAGDLSGGTK